MADRLSSSKEEGMEAEKHVKHDLIQPAHFSPPQDLVKNRAIVILTLQGNSTEFQVNQNHLATDQ
jgi:hypothetical protein